MKIPRLHFAPEIRVALCLMSQVMTGEMDSAPQYSSIWRYKQFPKYFEPLSGWQLGSEALLHEGKSTSPWLSDIPERNPTPRAA